MFQSIIQTIRIFFVEFCNKSNIHGFRYITEQRRHWSERLWWLISIGLSLWLCGLMIRDVWIQWNKPIFDYSEKAHISTVPFPTVTICPEMKNLKHKFDLSSKFDNNVKLVENLSDIEFRQLSALAHVCLFLPLKIRFKDEFTNESIYNFIADVAPSLEYTIKECWWQRKRINCSEYMSLIWTQNGLCFAFNALNSNDVYTNETVSHPLVVTKNWKLSRWSLESGYDNKFVDDKYPIRAYGSGQNQALVIVLSSNTQDHGDIFCNGIRHGFLIFLTDPGEPIEPLSFLKTENAENTLIAVKPKMTVTAEELNSWTPMKRGCFFNSERQLRFFKSYTETNCARECAANLTKRLCNCVGFFMPRDAHTKICGAAKIKCYQESVRLQTTIVRECNCLPSCSYIKYEAEIDRAKFIASKINNSQQQTRLTIFYGAEDLAIEKRMERYTFGEFVAICGGLLGLFMGVSFLSVIEIVYLSTLRLFWIVFRPKSKKEDEQSDRKDSEAISDDGNSFTFENRAVQKLFQFILKIRPFFTDFCDKNSMHGFRYLSERKLHWSERIFWLIALCVSLWFCRSMIRNVWIQWAENPMIMSSDEKIASAETIPFPTLTICPEIKTTKDKLDITAALNSLSNLTDIDWKRLNALAHLCPLLPHLIEYKDNFTDESIYDTIQDIAPNIQQSTYQCIWQNHFKPCTPLVTPVLTEDGLCFTFNALNSHEIYTDEMAPGMVIAKSSPNISGWDFESGYANQSAKGNYPYQLQGVTSVILMDNRKDIEYQCRGCDKGFKLMLSMPGETVETTQNYLRLPSLHQHMIQIQQRMTVTSGGLRGYTPNQRQCFYSSDNPLRFFKIYTKKNCQAECKANFTAIDCGCVKFSMPRDIHTRICGGAKRKCYEAAQRTLFTSERGKIFREQCNCLPSCTYIKYTAEMQRISLDNTKIHQLGVPKNLEFSSFSLISKTNNVLISTRKEMFTFADFLAACGGLLGLFIGVSALSIIEIIYYVTLRLFWTIKMKKSNRVGPEN